MQPLAVAVKVIVAPVACGDAMDVASAEAVQAPVIS